MKSEDLPLSVLNLILNKSLGKGWDQYEPETLMMTLNDLGLPPSDLLREKVQVLRLVSVDPELFYTDFLFFLHAVEVMNGNVANFDSLPSPTSLEVAFSVIDMAKVLGVKLEESPHFSTGVVATIKRCLVEDGYSEPVSPFDVVGLGPLEPGQTTLDTENKAKAITQYVASMCT